MELRNALQSLRNHGSALSSGIREDRRTAVVGDTPLMPVAQATKAAASGVFQLEESGNDDFDMDFSDDEFFQDAALLNLSDYDSQTSSAASRQLPASAAPPSIPLSLMTASPHTTATHTLTQSQHHHNTPHSMALPRPKSMASILDSSPGRQQVPRQGEISLSTSFQPNTSFLASCQNTSSTDCSRQQLNNVLNSSTTSSIQQLRSFSFSKQPPRPHPVCVTGLTSENPAKRRAVYPQEDTLNSTAVATEVPAQCLSSPVDQLASSKQCTSSTPSAFFPHSSRTPGTHTPRSTRVLSQEGYTVLPSTPQSLENTPFRANSTSLTLSAPRDPHKVSSTMTTPITTPTRPPVHGVGTITPTVSGLHVKRKFPGPAGILPKLAPGQRMDSLKVLTPLTASPATTPRARRIAVSTTDLPCSQEPGGQQEFCQGPWVRMMEDLDMNDSHTAALLQYNISSVIKQASQRKLTRGKVPFLRVQLKSIVPSSRSASVVLKDPTGEMLATVHIKVLNEYQAELQPGCVLVLRQTSVFSPSRHKHYLNITLENIVRVYPVDMGTSPQQTLRLSEFEGPPLSLEQPHPLPTSSYGGPVPVVVTTAKNHPCHEVDSSRSAPALPVSALVSSSSSTTTTTTSTDGADPNHKPSNFTADIDEDEFDNFLKDIDDSFLDF